MITTPESLGDMTVSQVVQEQKLYRRRPIIHDERAFRVSCVACAISTVRAADRARILIPRRPRPSSEDIAELTVEAEATQTGLIFAITAERDGRAKRDIMPTGSAGGIRQAASGDSRRDPRQMQAASSFTPRKSGPRYARTSMQK